VFVTAVYLATGLVWTCRSLLEIVAHPDYWEPSTIIDWVAVWSYSLAFGLLALAVSLLARDARAGRLVMFTSLIVGVAAVLAAVGNAVEDAFDVAGASTVYVIGALGTLIGLLVLAAALLIVRRPKAALVAGLIAVGVVTMTIGLGFLVLVGGVLAARERFSWRHQPGPSPA
jgi:hypothetical protein